MSAAEWDERRLGIDREAGIKYSRNWRTIRPGQPGAEIGRRFPRLLRRVSGYNLDVLRDRIAWMRRRVQL